MTLRKGQKELIEQYREGFCGISAIPGGGKTYSLTKWVTKAIVEGLVGDSKILILTYMNSAVNHFKQKIALELNHVKYQGKKRYFVSTIHGLCLQIIKESPDLVLTNDDFQVIDDRNRNRLIKVSIDEWKKKNEERFQFFIASEGKSVKQLENHRGRWQNDLIKIVDLVISDCKSRGIAIGQALEKAKELPNYNLLKICLEIYGIFDQKMKMLGFFDFSDMLFYAKKILVEQEIIRKKFQLKYAFVCEDEAQDSNAIQNDILQIVAQGDLLRVGDSNQAICGSFSHSDVNIFKRFIHKPDTKVFYITQSSRNTKEIIHLANYFMEYVMKTHPEPRCREALVRQIIEPVGDKDPFPNPINDHYGIKVSIFETMEAEILEIIKRIRYLKQRFPYKTIAILSPTTWKIDEIDQRLSQAGLAFERLDNQASDRNKVLNDLGKILQFIAIPDQPHQLFNIIFNIFLERPAFVEGHGISKSDCDALMSQKTEIDSMLTKHHLENVLYPPNGSIPKQIIPEKMQKEVVGILEIFLEVIRQFLEFPQNFSQKLVLYISEILRFSREERAVACKVASDIEVLMREHKQYRLIELSEELLDAKTRFNYFANIVYELKGYTPKPDKITLCTYHKSKGLEWDIVFLTGLTSQEFPAMMGDQYRGSYAYLKDPFKSPQHLVKNTLRKTFEGIEIQNPEQEAKIEIINERIRLLYVGITRAKTHLLLSCACDKQKKSKVRPSHYLGVLETFIHQEAREWKKT